MSAAGSAKISDARPHSAWVLVLVASATLWITGQLAPWVIGLQLPLLACAWWRREVPHPLQRSGAALNLGMLFITGTTIAVALRGHPSTVALAHFCALTQVLQIVDVRPRKSEFLLVALALFQVILAANLTDSPWFPPFLTVFVAAATWTLLVHTLRIEALRAEGPVRADAAITPSLVKLTALASALSLVLAIVFFVAMPRMKNSLVRGGLGASRAVAGFNDEVELGTLGRIRQDGAVVLRVETLAGQAAPPLEAYWRGLAFDSFDGTRWSISAPPGVALRAAVDGSPLFGRHSLSVPRGSDSGAEAGAQRLEQRITREPVSAGVLFAAGTIRGLAGPKARLERDPNGGLYAPALVEERIRYTVSTLVGTPDDAVLAGLPALAPLIDRSRGLRDERVLALPPVDAAIGELAQRIARDATTDLARVRALEAHLRGQGRYSDVPPQIDPGSPLMPVEQFLLGELAGHCEYFASGMVLLARSLGLPARLVNGFAGGRPNRLGGFVELTRSDAHAWVEVHFEGAGWVRFDPTPPGLRLRAGSEGLMAQFAAFGSAFELWWFQRVVEFDSSDQVAALRSAFHAWRRFKPASADRSGPARAEQPSLRERLGAHATAVGLGGLALAGALWLGWRRRRAGRPVLPPGYARALRHLEARGIRRHPGMAARDLVAEARSVVSPRAAHAFAKLTDAYLAERFGEHVNPSEFWRDALRDFEHHLKNSPDGSRRA